MVVDSRAPRRVTERRLAPKVLGVTVIGLALISLSVSVMIYLGISNGEMGLVTACLILGLVGIICGTWTVAVRQHYLLRELASAVEGCNECETSVREISAKYEIRPRLLPRRRRKKSSSD